MSKNLLTQLGETIDQYRVEKAQQPPSSQSPIQRLGWLIPNGGTILVVLLLVATQSVWARVLPNALTNSTGTISYQGRLADINGDPLTGIYNLEFRLYDVPVGGAPLWDEFWTGGNSVQVSDGLFNVMLGSLNPTLASVIDGHDALFLGITVGTDSEMVPRVQLGSVPFSMQALTVPDSSITTEKIADGAITSSKLAPGTFENIVINQANVLANVQSIYSDVEKSTPAWGYVDLAALPVDLSEAATLRISYHSIVWKSAASGRTALGIRIDGPPNSSPDGNSNVQMGMQLGSFWDSHNLSNTFFINVPPGMHTVTLVLGSWDAGTSYARAYALNTEILRQP